jgi:hypothetical protein
MQDMHTTKIPFGHTYVGWIYKNHEGFRIYDIFDWSPAGSLNRGFQLFVRRKEAVMPTYGVHIEGLKHCLP